MTPEQQRIAIAESCGWHERQEPVGSYNATAWWWGETRYPSNVMPVPDYLNDLNAMHEALKSFKDDETLWHTFRYHLIALLHPAQHELHATAKQYAEAFLRAIEKWEES